MKQYEYIAHHGIKGQKWGVRRYQNPDGTLTDEGRRRYGYGREAESLVTKNTADRTFRGAKLGAKVGAAYGGTVGAIVGLAGASALMPYYGIPAAVAYAGSAFISSTVSGSLSGGLDGAVIGAIVGTVETRRGRNYIERYDKGLADFEKRDRK